MLHALFIITARGDVLVSKIYQDGIRRNVVDIFRIQVINSAARKSTLVKKTSLPVLTLGSTSFLHIKENHLYFVAVTRSNQDALVIFEFLFNFLSLLLHTFAKGVLTDEIVVNNFVAIHDILDVAVDAGYPVSLEPKFLSQMAPTLSLVKFGEEPRKGIWAVARKNSKTSEPVDDHHKVSWRENGIKYRKNEIHLNVAEKLTVILDSKGRTFRSQIDGTIMMKLHLSGMPVCRFGFTDGLKGEKTSPVTALEGVKFHQSVDSATYAQNLVVRFIPPDGTFQLMSYTVSEDFELPFRIAVHVVEARATMKVLVLLSLTFPSRQAATGVVLKIPTPGVLGKNQILASSGKARHDVDENGVVWRFLKFYGQQEHSLTIEFEAPNSWARPALKLDFVMEMFSASGLQVKYLEVLERARYKTIKWVKYTTHAGSYEVRW